MEQGFIDVLKQLVSEQSNAALTDARRCRALLADYAQNEYKKERGWLVLAVEAGVARAIVGTDDIVACRKTQVRDLREEHGLTLAVAMDIVNTLMLVLQWGANVAVPPSTPKAVEEPIATVVEPAVAVERPIIVVPTQDLTFTDPRDGQTYRTVKIGGLIWMAENLNYKTNGSWCYGNNESNGKKYGRLYTWDDALAASPAGWHLPSREEWDELVEAAGGKEVAGRALKSKIGWNGRKDGTSGNGTDEFGFSATPSGYRYYFGGSFGNAGGYGYWWSAMEIGVGNAYRRYMNYSRDNVYEYHYDKGNGFSVRCVQNA